jgi:hypothetical protein
MFQSLGERSLFEEAGQQMDRASFGCRCDTQFCLVANGPGMMLGDWMLPFAYNETIAGFDNAVLSWVMFGGMVALGSFAGSATSQKESHLSMEPIAMAQRKEQV